MKPVTELAPLEASVTALVSGAFKMGGLEVYMKRQDSRRFV